MSGFLRARDISTCVVLRPYVFTLTDSRKRAFAGLLLHAQATKSRIAQPPSSKWEKTARTSSAKYFLNSAWLTNYVDCTAFVNGFPVITGD
jgi:hypothetical protein